MSEVFTFVKYTFGDEKFIYTFDGVTNGSYQMRIIMNIMQYYTEKKIQKNRIEIYKKNLHLKIYNIKHLNGKEFKEKLIKKEGHVIMGFCYSDSDSLVKDYLNSVPYTNREVQTCTITAEFPEHLAKLIFKN